MSRGMTLSVLGLYKADSGLFSEMVYPAGFTDDEKQTVVGNILAECAELECLFTDPGILKTMIGLWSKMNISVWERIFTASQLEYNPIENYDRYELETITDDHTDTHSGTDSTQSNNTSTNSGTDSNINSITSYDSNNYQAHDKSDLTHGHVVTDGGSSSFIHGEKITHDGDISRDNHTHGNIGIRSSQELLEQEIELSAKLNVIKMIVESFKERFCLLVY